MYLAAVCVILVLMKAFDIAPVATWSWWTVLAPFALLFFWWEFGAKWLGFEKREAARKMRKAEEEARETKKKARGF